MNTIERQQLLANQLLPNETLVIERNKKITSIYAGFYLENKRLFKWAGFAAFASHQMGLAIQYFKFYQDKNGKVNKSLLNKENGIILDDIDLFRIINNEVYTDIAWLHILFASPNAGIKTIREILSGKESWEDMLEAFECLDKGRILINSGSKEYTLIDQLIWRANYKILKREQFLIVQKNFVKFDFLPRVLLSYFSYLDFDARHSHIDYKSGSSFYIYMLTRGFKILLKSFSLPRIVNIEHRWYWIEKRLLTTWKKIENQNHGIEEVLKMLMFEKEQ